MARWRRQPRATGPRQEHPRERLGPLLLLLDMLLLLLDMLLLDMLLLLLLLLVLVLVLLHQHLVLGKGLLAVVRVTSRLESVGAYCIPVEA